MRLLLLCTVAALVALSGIADAKTYRMRSSFYGKEAGTRLSTGKHFDPSDPTVAACLQLPIGTRIRVTNPSTQKTIHMTVQDKGPAKHTGRQLDVSKGAAVLLGFIKKGVTTLVVEVQD